jgi:hypothetical protein
LHHVLIAPDPIPEAARGLPVVFLAGPIMGAPRWQDSAIEMLKASNRDIIIASPRRAADRWEDFSQDDYERQVDWESHHLRLACTTGVICFWLAKEEKHVCDRAYAQTSRFELGEWFERCWDGPVVGVEEGFSGGRYIRHRLKREGMEVHSTLESTILAVRARLHSS